MIDPTRARRILVVALDNLGDLVFASALVPPLRAAFPDATIDLWSKAYNAPVARLIPQLDEVLGADPFWAVPFHMARPPVLPFVRSIADVRRRRYEVALLTGAPWRTAAAVAATRIPIRVALSRHHNQRFVTHLLPEENPRRSVLLEHARLLEPLGVRSTAPRYSLDAERLGAVRASVAARLPSEFVAFHPFASARSRCVPLSEWTQLAFAMHAHGLPTLWIGTPGELAELRSSVTHPRGMYVDQLGEGSLAESAAALSLATLFVGHDSGPLHVAGAFGVPVVGVFAPGQPERTFPQGTGPWRMIARPSPADITCATIMREVEALRLVSPA
jgi:ADP-heptose:LPS heptosyltransferase